MFCRKCGGEIKDDAVVCMKCGVPTGAKINKDPGQDALVRALLPVGRSGYAITAGYLAFFSILFIPAPFALLFGILAIRDIKRNPEKHGMGRAMFGVIMGTIFTILLILWFVHPMTIINSITGR
ncbi:MAG: DUF4190 domain-containing protein [Candidatus Omnitrophica bacterium]|nr:DUF4190 domain-containing protein [Candidatus Omnitrophota bacterium]